MMWKVFARNSLEFVWKCFSSFRKDFRCFGLLWCLSVRECCGINKSHLYTFSTMIAMERKPGLITGAEAAAPSPLAEAASCTGREAAARSGPTTCIREERRGSWQTTAWKSTIKKPRAPGMRRAWSSKALAPSPTCRSPIRAVRVVMKGLNFCFLHLASSHVLTVNMFSEFSV